MLSMGVQAVLVVVVLLGVAATKAQTSEGNVEFWKNKVTLTCPEEGSWFDKNGAITEKDKDNTYTFNYTSKGKYRCEYGTDPKKYFYFYVEGNVCEDCYELDGNTLFTVIVGDLLLTIIVMIIVYKCTKKKSSAGPPQPSKAPPRSGGRGPPVPSPDYEQLNPQTRAQDTYSTVVNRMG